MAKKKATGWQRNFVIGADKFIRQMAIRWLLLLNLLVFVYVGLPFLAPVLMANGITGPANTIYNAYGFVCHQFAFRSWYLFGEQPAYPRQRARTDLDSFESVAADDPHFAGIDVSELDTDLVIGARTFRGNDEVGYKVAFCQRDVAIYGGILLAGLVYGLFRDRVRSLRFWQYVLIGIVPIGLDGFSQLFVNPPFDEAGLGVISLIGTVSKAIFGVRESTPMLRTLTGLLFGVANVWLAYPHINEAMEETRENVEGQLSKGGVTFE